MSEGAKVAVGRGAIGKEVKHGGLTLGVVDVERWRRYRLEKWQHRNRV